MAHSELSSLPTAVPAHSSPAPSMAISRRPASHAPCAGSCAQGTATRPDSSASGEEEGPCLFFFHIASQEKPCTSFRMTSS
jgi:hypothetical protein